MNPLNSVLDLLKNGEPVILSNILEFKALIKLQNQCAVGDKLVKKRSYSKLLNSGNKLSS